VYERVRWERRNAICVPLYTSLEFLKVHKLQLNVLFSVAGRRNDDDERMIIKFRSATEIKVLVACSK
jgi:hypothetical protein